MNIKRTDIFVNTLFWFNFCIYIYIYIYIYVNMYKEETSFV